MATDIERSLENLKLERDAIVLYDRLSEIERDRRRAAAFRMIARNERRHAEIWATRLREQGAVVPPPGAPRLRIRAILLLARAFGTRAVSDLVRALEGDEEATYGEQGDSPDLEAIAADERKHAEIWRQLDRGAPGSTAADEGDGQGPAAETEAETAKEITSRERWHRAGQSGTLRAVIFGVSDGLVSNTSLVMGVSGASADPHLIFLTGVAGLFAGSFSMAAGEYVSMQSQRELFERQIALEREELRMVPEEEEAELAALYRAKGFTADEAKRIAHRLFRDPDAALDTLIREELGLDPEELGNPWRAAGGSFVAFAIGAAVPVVPYLFGGGGLVFATSIGISLLAMFAVGVGVSLLTGRSALFSGVRQVAIGVAAAAVTYVVGRIVGVSIG
ncbi:MAG TPA: VIT1/CCC1 transporter family protein [Candidatus Limnocylindrales bacterium]|nr:VIT1/CCC1 transporter family protein [Candidatus Limnocylindrales bacterium]